VSRTGATVCAALAVVVAIGAAAGCEKDRASTAAAPSPAPAPAGGSSAGAGSAAEPSCTDAEIDAHLEQGFAAVEHYFGEMAKLAPRWSDCAVATADLLALEPAAHEFEATVTAVKGWASSVSASCRERTAARGEANTAASAFQEKYAALEQPVTSALERCKDHPGFQDAASRGLRVMKKKTP